MGLQSALTTSLTGLQAAETTISVVGNNVANSNTVGFKASDTVFATQFLQTISIGSAPNTNLGGTNPQQIGLGVQVSQIAPDFSQGTIEISSNPLDLAIQGDGFLIVQGLQGEDLYTRNGQLSLNSLNELTTVNGQRVTGFGVDDDFNLQTAQRVPLTIPLGEQQVAQATSVARLAGNLNPAVTLGSTPSVSESAVFTNGNLTRPDATAFVASSGSIFTSTPPAVPTTISSGGGAAGPDTTEVTYRIVSRDADGNEGAFSNTFTLTGHNAGASATGESVDITDFPGDGTNGGFTDFVIYRQEDGGTRFFEVGSVAAPGATDPQPVFSDTVDEATLLTNSELVADENIEVGNYTYFVTYFNPTSQTETAPTLLGNTSISQVGGSRVRLDLSLLEPGDTGFSELRIYRNVSGSEADFRRVDTGGLASPQTGAPAAAFIDAVPSASLGDALNLEGAPPAGSNLLLDLQVRGGSIQNPTFTNVFGDTGTLTFDANIAGIDIDQQSFRVNSDTTIEELAFFIEDALGITASSTSPAEPFPIGTGGSVIFQNGQFVVTSNLGEQNAIEIPQTAFNFVPDSSTTQGVTESIGINFSETQQANGPGTTTELTVFDSLGLPVSVRVTTVFESFTGSSSTYRWFATSGDNQPIDGSSTFVGDGLLTFDAEGNLLPGSADQIAIQRNNTASVSPLAIDLDFSGVAGLGTVDAQNELTSSLNFTSQDGFPPGVLTDFIITDDGIIQGQFSNGVQRPLGQIQLARFSNPQGLQAIGDNLFAQSVNSGEPITDDPGANGLGTLSAGAVELSNTDIGQNLIELILASTQYRGGSRVITATQELIDELLALT